MNMISETPRPKARQYVETLASTGHYHFDSVEAQSALGVSVAAAKLALNRLAKQNFIASPARGFYVVVPPEYRGLGSPPADQFIPALMKRRGLPYYVGLLSAAQYHGAAHQRPQEFQVFLDRTRRPIVCGMVRVAFIVRKHLRDVPVQSFNTPRGTVLVSTPEATALDLVGYQRRAGGLGQVATVLCELAERINSGRLAAAAAAAPVAWAQRLGYLLEHVGASEKAVALGAYVRTHANESTALVPGEPHEHAPRHDDWKLYINSDVEAEL
jgi:predicted transcriptional regulator of viral defense system